MKNNINNISWENGIYLIFPHIIPDGDTLGSAIGLKNFLKSRGNEVYVVYEGEIPYNITFLDYSDFYTIEEFENRKISYDYIVSVDGSDLERMGTRRKFLKDAKELYNIDHHRTNLNFGDINLVDIEAAATGEIIFRILDHFDYEFTKKDLEAIYTAISTDTGSFKYTNTTSETMNIAGRLIDMGLDLEKVNLNLYHNVPLKKMKITAELINNMSMYSNDRLCVVKMTQAILEKHEAKFSEVDGVIESVRDINGVSVVALLKEFDSEEIKVSMRSKGEVDVSEIALGFDGGGHSKAAGCMIKGSINSAEKLIVDRILEAM